MPKAYLFIAILCTAALTACAPTQNNAPAALNVEFEKITLDNGLDVVLHIDRSDPIVAIDLAVHVGSAREVTGRTGFAHLFEHLLFLDSENLGYKGLDVMNNRIGGEGTNGFTTHDMTQYYQAVPKDGLEKIIWAEADKLGYFIKTVSQNVIDNEKQVVKNEKRQRVDNRPYGHNFFVINKALFPEDHPYNWQVIGSLKDLEAASLQDVHEFHKKWYAPNNVTLTIAGDFDLEQAKIWVKKYFGDIPRGEDIAPAPKRAAKLDTVKSLYHEDGFATVPQLTMVWPAVERYHADSYPLAILMQYLTDGKRAPFNQVLIDEQSLTSSVGMFNYEKELAGEAYLIIRANDGTDLDALLPAIDAAFARFEQEGVSQDTLEQIKTSIEISVYKSLQSALKKAIELGEYNVLTGDPGGLSRDVERLRNVTADDIMRVYRQYIKDKPYVATSFVPKDQVELALSGAVKADVVEEKIIEGADAPVEFDPAARVIDEPTFSSFDRTVEPPFGPAYEFASPNVTTGNIGPLGFYGIESDEIPLVNFSLRIEAGRDHGDPAKPAVPALTADLMSKGTADKTTAELEDALKALGSTIKVSTGDTATFIAGTSLARNFDATIALMEEMILSPRWDAEEFEILKRSRLNTLIQSEGSPEEIARREALKLRYPSDHMYHYTPYGTKDTLEAVTIDDLKAFHAKFYTSCDAKIRVVGAVDKAAVAHAMDGLLSQWNAPCPPAQNPLPVEAPIKSSQLYFYDVPGAKQSIIRMSRPSVAAPNPDYSLLRAINVPLGGIYTSDLNSELRINKGYTYGIWSGFIGDEERGSFRVSTSVRSNVTQDSLRLIIDIIDGFGEDYDAAKVESVIDSRIRRQALSNETLDDKLRMLGQISAYGYPVDYQARDAKRLKTLTLEQLKSLVDAHMVTGQMRYLVVGDAATQAAGLAELGLGEPIMLNERAAP